MPKKRKSGSVKLIANPGSGQMTGGQLLEQVTRALKDRGFKLDVVLARPNEEAIPIARRAARDGCRLVIAMGGDDTVWAVIQGIAGTKTKLGIIPAGTENNVARSLGIPDDDPEAACELIASGKTRRLDVGQAKVGKKKLTFFQMVTIGIASALYPDVEKVPKGKLAGVKNALITVVRHPPEPNVYLTLDGESKVKVKTMLVTVANMPIMGAHFLVSPHAVLDDGLLDIATYPEFAKAELASYFVQVREEGQADESKVQRYRASKLKVKCTPKMEVLADGTMLGKGTVRIKVRPRALRVIAPKVGAGVETADRMAIQGLPAPVSPTAAGAETRG